MQKQQQRKLAYQMRKQQQNRTMLSARIASRVTGLISYQTAKTVMCYIHCRSEVETGALIHRIQADGKRCVVPFCTTDLSNNRILGLWRLDNIDELVPGTWGIPEPPKTRWNETEKQVLPEQLDFIIVPGVAFSSQGARLGNGAGYYDRLFEKLPSQTIRCGIGFEVQLQPDLIMDAHDVYMHWVVTESSVYAGIKS